MVLESAPPLLGIFAQVSRVWPRQIRGGHRQVLAVRCCHATGSSCACWRQNISSAGHGHVAAVAQWLERVLLDGCVLQAGGYGVVEVNTDLQVMPPPVLRSAHQSGQPAPTLLPELSLPTMHCCLRAGNLSSGVWLCRRCP